MSRIEQKNAEPDIVSEILELAKNEKNPLFLRKLLVKYKDELEQEKLFSYEKRNGKKMAALSAAIRSMEARLTGTPLANKLGKGDIHFLKGKHRKT